MKSVFSSLCIFLALLATSAEATARDAAPDPAALPSLPLHSDQSILSFTIALNDPAEYEGGGTWFRGLGMAVDAAAAGHVVMFPGKLEHAGHPITSGTRYVIVLFCGYDSNLSER